MIIIKINYKIKRWKCLKACLNVTVNKISLVARIRAIAIWMASYDMSVRSSKQRIPYFCMRTVIRTKQKQSHGRSDPCEEYGCAENGP